MPVPDAGRITRASCSTGFAGLGGVCELCPPGARPLSGETACVPCLPGTYRNAEISDACSDCTQRGQGTYQYGMISEPGSTYTPQ